MVSETQSELALALLKLKLKAVELKAFQELGYRIARVLDARMIAALLAEETAPMCAILGHQNAFTDLNVTSDILGDIRPPWRSKLPATWQVTAPTAKRSGQAASRPGRVWLFCDEHLVECVRRHIAAKG